MAKKPILKTARRSSGQKNRELEKLIQHGAVEDVPLDQVDRDENQPRPHQEVMEGIEAFADEIERDNFKLIQLPVYHIKEDGRRMVVVGERRTAAFRLKGRETIPAICKRFTEQELKDAYVLQYVENDGRLKKELSPLADARWWRNYADQYHGGRLGEAAEARGRSLVEVSNRVSLLNADPSIVEFIQKNELRDPATYAALGRLAKRGGLSMTHQVFEDYESGGFKGSLRTYAERLANEVRVNKGGTGQKQVTPKNQDKPLVPDKRQPEDRGRQALSGAQELLKAALFSADVLAQSPGEDERYTAYTRLIAEIDHAIRSLEKSQTHYQALRARVGAEEQKE